MMNKSNIYDYLNRLGIHYEVTEHAAVYRMSELSDIELPYPTADAKNLFVRDDKKQRYYLITVRGDKRVDLKEFRRTHGTRPLSFASEQELWNVLELLPGSVSPLGVLNDREHRSEVYLDRDFLDEPGLIGVHPNDNTATIWLKTEDLIRIVEKHGNAIYLTEI